ncbi:Orotidine 5'-phosphate decarboxylase [Gammaproteobacteria bacterium]
MLSSLNKNIPIRERLIVALDVPRVALAKELVEQLRDSVFFYKLGLELSMSGEYFNLIDWLRERGKKVFADLKFFDVPETVARAVRQLTDRNIQFVSVHGDDAMLAAAVKVKKDLKILAVTVLTSLNRQDLDDLGFQCEVEDLVLSRAKRALQIGCDGIISSGLEVAKLREHFGSSFIVVSPGIRPVENRLEDDQKRVVTVEQAFHNGADYIVVGRPIRDSIDPRITAEDIQTSITRAISFYTDPLLPLA